MPHLPQILLHGRLRLSSQSRARSLRRGVLEEFWACPATSCQSLPKCRWRFESRIANVRSSVIGDSKAWCREEGLTVPRRLIVLPLPKTLSPCPAMPLVVIVPEPKQPFTFLSVTNRRHSCTQCRRSSVRSNLRTDPQSIRYHSNRSHFSVLLCNGNRHRLCMDIQTNRFCPFHEPAPLACGSAFRSYRLTTTNCR
jgi:hypothetical protein